MDILSDIINSFYSSIEDLFSIDIKKLKNLSTAINYEQKKGDFGDISSNVAILLAKVLDKDPKDVALSILSNFKNSYIKNFKVAGPGFINLYLNLDAIKKIAFEIFTQPDYFKSEDNIKNYSIEFISANPTGPLHVGHGRGGVIGDVLSNILTFLSNKVTKEFYINDAGVQIEKLGESLKIRILNQLGKDINLKEDLYHGDYIIDLAKKFIKDYSIKSESDLDNLEFKDKDFFSDYAKNILLDKIKNTLENYNIKYDNWFSEKKLHKDGSIERTLNKIKDYIYEKDGALWFKSSKFSDEKDRVIKKSDGDYTYLAADIAYLDNKLSRKFDKIIMVLGQDHHGYVARLKGIMKALGHNEEDLDIILYQLVTIKENNQVLRLSKRAGKIITLQDIIDLVGSDVARFFYLNKKADAHLDFDLNLALKQTDENPVYYIQYAYVRTNSIINNGLKDFSIEQEDYNFISESEKALILKIANLKQLLNSIKHNYQVHLLTYYTLELAQLFHNYYSLNKVINKDNLELSKGRLFLINLLNRTFYICFKLIGISTPESM